MKATLIRTGLILSLSFHTGYAQVLSVSSEEEATAVTVDLQELLKAKSFTNSIGMTMVRIVPNFWAGAYLVTQADYKAVVGTNPSRFQGEDHPVDSVSWNDAVKFCRLLTAKEKTAEMLPEGFSYTLPTQAQWLSLMARSTLEQAVSSYHMPRSGSAPVGTLAPNRLGLYDTRGNLWQWCLDPQDQPYRVLKGGAWNSWIETNLRPEFRWYSRGPGDRHETFGFRIVLAPEVVRP